MVVWKHTTERKKAFTTGANYLGISSTQCALYNMTGSTSEI